MVLLPEKPVVFFLFKKISLLMRKLGIYGNTENQGFLLESKFFFDKIKNTRFFSRKASFSDKPVNWPEKPDFSGRNQKFLLQILTYRKTSFFLIQKYCTILPYKYQVFLISFS